MVLAAAPEASFSAMLWKNHKLFFGQKVLLFFQNLILDCFFCPGTTPRPWAISADFFVYQ